MLLTRVAYTPYGLFNQHKTSDHPGLKIVDMGKLNIVVMSCHLTSGLPLILVG